jgi:hypothetical protein
VYAGVKTVVDSEQRRSESDRVCTLRGQRSKEKRNWKRQTGRRKIRFIQEKRFERDSETLDPLSSQHALRIIRDAFVCTISCFVSNIHVIE